MPRGVDGYETGPDATVRAAATAWQQVGTARVVVLVEGVSDQIAVDASARVSGRDLAAEHVLVLPMGGAQAVRGSLAELARRAPGAQVCGLYDLAEERHFSRALGGANTDDLERAGFFVCVADLEDELIRAAGSDLVEQVVAAEGDTASLAAMRAQPAWRDAPFEDQVRRFIGAGARRKLRYAAALVEALGPRRLPTPLAAVLAVTAAA